MKKTILILMVVIVGIGCESEELTIIDNSIDYSLIELNSSRITIALQSLDIDNNDFAIKSYTPNTSCCLGGTFTTNNTVDGFVDDSNLAVATAAVNDDFQISLENFSEGMNYYTVELDNGSYKKYFSFQFNLENDEIDYLTVVSNGNNDKVLNYDDAIFRFDIHTANTIRILQETEAGFNVFSEQIVNDTNQFSFITSLGATVILKTSIEKL